MLNFQSAALTLAFIPVQLGPVCARKKARRYAENCPMQRANYLARWRFKSHGQENSVYCDESGFEKHSYRPHGGHQGAKKFREM